jgi:O-antigen/teichoic acid export membrane protein
MNQSMQRPRIIRVLLHAFSDGGPRLLRDLFSLVGGQFFSMAIGFLSFTYLARVLDPPSYGSMEYAIGVAAFFTVIVECGLGPVGVSHLAREPGRTRELAAQIPAARLLLAVMTIPLVGLSSYVTGQDHQTTALVWVFAFSLFGIPWRQDWLLQALEKMGQAAPGPAVRMLAFALGVFLLVRHAEDLMFVGLVQIAAEAMGSAYYIVVQHFWAIPFKLDLRLSEMWRLIREGASVGVSQIVWTFSQYAPLFLVASLIGGSETAWFGAPLRILLALLAFGFLYHFNLLPISARLLKEDREEWSRLMQTSVRVAAWGGVGIALILTLMSQPLMVLIFGKNFIASVPVFSILIWVLPIRLLADHARWTLVASSLQRYLLIAEIVGAITLTISGIIMIPMDASQGAAAAAVIGNLVTWATAHFFVVRHVGRLPSFHVPFVPAGAAFLCAILASLINWGAFMSAAITIAGYAICASVLGGSLMADIKWLAYAKNTPPSSV